MQANRFPSPTRIRKFTKKEEPISLMRRGNSRISQCNTGPIDFIPLHMKSVAGNGLPLVHTLRTVGCGLTASESSEPTKWKLWLPPPITQTLGGTSPSLPLPRSPHSSTEMFLGRAHGEAGGGGSHRRLRFLVKWKDWGGGGDCVVCFLFRGFFYLVSLWVGSQVFGLWGRAVSQPGP